MLLAKTSFFEAVDTFPGILARSRHLPTVPLRPWLKL